MNNLEQWDMGITVSKYLLFDIKHGKKNFEHRAKQLIKKILEV